MNTEQPLLARVLFSALCRRFTTFPTGKGNNLFCQTESPLLFRTPAFARLAITVKAVCFLLLFSCTRPIIAQNAIVTENRLTGTPASTWDINGAGDLSIQGFATDISYNKGSTAIFKIDTDASAYTVDIYRLGYYQGNGARLVGTGTITATLPQTQPSCLTVPATGLVDCGNWAASAEWDIPNTAVSGIYIAKLTRSDNNGASHIAFIVRDDASTSNLYFKTSDATWQAYNGYGGNSLYTGTVSGFPSGHAPKVSYNRPFLTRSGGAGGGPAEDWIFNSEYPMIRWLERNGYDVTYTTDVDANRFGNLIQNHKVFLSVGHDEYWSLGERNNVTVARDAGVHLAFFSGNEVYWKTRWENSIDGSGTSYRTLVCYKEGPGGENTTGVKSDPSLEWTGLWRYGCAPTYDPLTNNACDPENALTGQVSWDGSSYNMEVADTYKNLRFWRNTNIANLGTGQTITFSGDILGYEWDWEQSEFASSYPRGRVLMSTSVRGGKTHHLSLYRHTSGALVFGAGTVQWAWGLDENHDRGNAAPINDMQQATVNLFADMGVQPATLQNDLDVAAQSTDIQAPATTITNPVDNASLPSGASVNITGTATDAGGGVVAGVEISFDGGTTWQVANVAQITSATTWTFSWIPLTEGPTTIQSRAFDDSGNMGTPTIINVIITAPLPPNCPCSIWNSATIPTTITENDNTAIEVGVKFRSTVNGYITGIRFYKGSQNVGTHTGNLWTTAGQNLARIVFTTETADGWQQMLFNNPIAITANTTYIASYHTTSGYYSEDENYFNPNAVINPPLRALANGTDGPNGVYIYTVASVFPNQTFNASNYWVDVVFETEVGPDVTPPTVQSTIPANAANGIAINATINATFSEAIDPNTVSNSTFELRDGLNNLVTANISYNVASRTATLIPAAPLNYSSPYTGKITGGTTDPRIKDLAGNALQNNFTWTFTTAATPPPPPTEGPGGPILVISAATNPFSRYPVEILRAEGLNEFSAMDISLVTASILNDYDVVILGEIPLNAAQVTLLNDWVNAGGILIAFRPDVDLATLLGLTPVAGTLSEGYLLINNAGPGVGIVNQTIQFHGTADYYTLNGATSLATLYSNATTATIYPAVTTRNVGSNGGKAIAFTYDLAKSIVYTRQGNPAWSGQNRDRGVTSDEVIRSNDLFFGNSTVNPVDPQTDWINLDKVQIPQADEQQRFLANIIIQNNLQNRPLPRFWYLPNRFKAAVVMTGDDHAGGLTDEFFDTFINLSPANCSVEDWECVRGSSYIYTNTNIGGQGATAYQNLGFEVGIHINTGCNVWTPTSLVNDFNTQLAQFANLFPTITPPCTHRTHCIAWSDWATQAKEQAARGIRLDVNYYYWPGVWVQNRPGMFTGSGMPMRFADLDGTIIDCYQVATQITDETEPPTPPTYVPLFINTLLDNAIGQNGYYGAFCMNLPISITGGQPNYAVVINGVTYTNISTSVTVSLAKSLWNNFTVPGTPAVNNDNSAVELGVKFQSSVSGLITGVRFYKGVTNTNTYTGRLWSGTGTLLATVTFPAQTIVGWQEAFFSTPVPINAGDTYVISYHTPVGSYAFNSNYFTTAFTNPNAPLTALASGVSGGNGVYKYGAGGIFPNETFNAANYWVDVVFVSNTTATFNLTSITDANGCTLTGNPIATTTVNINSNCGPLPIDLLDFKGWQEKEAIQLKWVVATQKENDYMAVERNQDGKQFKEIGRRAGAGTTTATKTYDLLDEKPFPGINYYRLRQVDFNGKATYHPIIAVNFNTKTKEIRFFPNPSSDHIIVQLSQPIEEPGTIQIMDLLGRVVLTLSFQSGFFTERIDLRQLAVGTYIFSIATKKETYKAMFVKSVN